ncbi:MAG: surface-adhesin E family protein [Nitrospirota bacterium]
MKSSIKIFIFLSILGMILFSSETDSEETNWKMYYEDKLASYFYDKDSIGYPYKEKQNIIAVWIKTVPHKSYLENNKKVGYFSDLVYMDCEKRKFRRVEILTHDVSEKLIEREKAHSTYYNIEPKSEREALYKKVCP